MNANRLNEATESEANDMPSKSISFYWKFLRRQILSACIGFALLGGYASESKAIDPGFWIFPLRQSSFEIDVTNRSEQIIDIDIKRRCIIGRCPVSIGIEFESKRGDLKNNAADPVKNAHVKEYFFVPRPERLSAFRFPLHARMKLLNAKSETIFDETKPLGESKNYSWGGSTITAKFGGVFHCLPSGKYKAVVEINQADQGISEFSVKLVVLNQFNMWCGD